MSDSFDTSKNYEYQFSTKIIHKIMNNYDVALMLCGLVELMCMVMVVFGAESEHGQNNGQEEEETSNAVSVFAVFAVIAIARGEELGEENDGAYD